MPKPIDDPSPLITSYFIIEDDALAPEEATRIIGIKPTSTGLKGDKRPGKRPDVPKSFWEIKVEHKKCYCIDEAICEILDILWPNRKKVVEFISSQNFKATIGSNITIYHDRPLYCLSPETMKRIAYFGVEWGLDIFDYSD